MQRTILIENINVFMEDAAIKSGNVLLENSIIKKITTEQIKIPSSSTVRKINGEGYHLIPGFIDTHIHGVDGADVMDGTETGMDTIANSLPREGTTSFLATTMTQSKKVIENALSNLAVYDNKDGQSEMIGIHLEGPFINHDKSGAQLSENIIPANIGLFTKWQQLAKGKIKTVTLAPECEGMDRFIPFLVENGLNVSAGHTNATYEQMKEAVDLGVRQVTHVCNAMSGIHHRDIGAVGATMKIASLSAELIADFIHVSKPMIELLYDQLGSARLMLITDSIKAKHLQPGQYEFGGNEIFVDEERALLKDRKTLAGSMLTMEKAVKNMLSLKGIILKDIIQMASINPAKQAGIFHRKGSIAIGKDADLLIVDDSINIKFTICRGVISYEGE